MNVIKTLLKLACYGILGLLGFILLVEAWFYFTAPVYIFQPPQPFSGPVWHNPYQGMDSTRWRKANFHFHNREWYGMTSGKGTGEDFWKTYGLLGYAAPQISNYQSISTFNQDSAFYIPVYEHGFGVRKKHQIVIGAREVLWRDYSLFQNLNHKQHIINLLRGQADIVAIAHPDWEGGYSYHDMAMLSNYDLVEALDKNWRSIPQWDAALSAGRPVYILADDDSHNITRPDLVGVCATLINAPENERSQLVSALKNGKAYGVDIYMKHKETFEEKAAKAKTMPRVNAVEIRNDTLFVRISAKALKIVFIGQGGKAKKEVIWSDNAWYRLQPEDTYIRTSILFFNEFGGLGSRFYLNPVFRTNGEPPYNKLTATVNVERTWIFRIFSVGSLLLLAVVAVKLRKLPRRKEKT